MIILWVSFHFDGGLPNPKQENFSLVDNSLYYIKIFKELDDRSVSISSVPLANYRKKLFLTILIKRT